MTQDELEIVMETAKQLKAAQEREDPPEARATLPNLTLEDIDRKAKEIPSEHKTSVHGGASLLLNSVQSNGILYSEVGLEFNGKLTQFYPAHVYVC